jgi:DNA-binding MarR family transcriptional regulator
MPSKAKVTATAHEIALVREFNRFYTRKIGVLQEGLLSSTYSLTEVRVMYELSRRGSSTASELASILGFDHGYMSRLLGRLQSLRLIDKRRSPSDGRELLLTLTSKGRRVYSGLDLRASSEIQHLLEGLSIKQIRKLLASMDMIRRLLTPQGSAGIASNRR